MNEQKQALVRKVAQDCGSLAFECSDVAGYVENVKHRITAHFGRLSELEGITDALIDQQDGVARSTREARDLSEDARARLAEGRRIIDQTMAVFEDVTRFASRVGERMTAFAAALEQVKSVSADIEQIASNTNMLALNATIEAARAGEAGRGFAVVAAEVKKLAKDTREASEEIGRTMSAMVAEAANVSTDLAGSLERTRQAKTQFDTVSAAVVEVSELVGRVDDHNDMVARSAEMVNSAAQRLTEGLTAFSNEARENGSQLVQVHSRLSKLENLSNEMYDDLSHSGIETADSAYIALARERAACAAAIVEAAIDAGEIGEEGVFDEDYRLITGSDPEQYLNGFTTFADRHFRPILDEIMETDPHIIASVFSDRNGYLPTHISARSHPPGGDPLWNAENCRNRRIFWDPATRLACQSERAFRMSTYRADLGGGRYHPVKNVFMPLHFRGRRWGNLEIAFSDVQRHRHPGLDPGSML